MRLFYLGLPEVVWLSRRELGDIVKKLFELAEFEYPPDVCQANPGIGVAQTSLVFL